MFSLANLSNSSRVQSIYNAFFGVQRNGPHYNGTFLQKNDDTKMTISWSFSYHSFVKFHGINNLGAVQHDPATSESVL